MKGSILLGRPPSHGGQLTIKRSVVLTKTKLQHTILCYKYPPLLLFGTCKQQTWVLFFGGQGYSEQRGGRQLVRHQESFCRCCVSLYVEKQQIVLINTFLGASFEILLFLATTSPDYYAVRKTLVWSNNGPVKNSNLPYFPALSTRK